MPGEFGDLAWGLLLASGRSLPLTIQAQLCELRPHFIPKGRVGRGYRAIARNGRVLLASHVPLEELGGLVARVRVQTWHRAILPGDAPEPYGILLAVRAAIHQEITPLLDTRLVARSEHVAELLLDIGGRKVLEFYTRPPDPP